MIGKIVLWAVFPNSSPSWTGFGEGVALKDINPSKTLWDWLQLLLIPLFIAIAGWYISSSEKKNSQERENEIFQQNLLKDFLDRITIFLKEVDEESLNNNKKHQSIGRAITLNYMRNADSHRRAAALQSLFECHLISQNPIINLNGAKLDDTYLNNIVLQGVEIRGAYLMNCSMKNTTLRKCDFRASNFSYSDISLSDLTGSNFEYSDMIGVIIKGVDLTSTNIGGVDFNDANLSGSKMTKAQFDKLKKGIKFKKQPIIIS